MRPEDAAAPPDDRLEKLITSLPDISETDFWLISCRAFKISFLSAAILDGEGGIKSKPLVYRPGEDSATIKQVIRSLQENIKLFKPKHGDLSRQFRHAILRRIFVLSMVLLERCKEQKFESAA